MGTLRRSKQRTDAFLLTHGCSVEVFLTHGYSVGVFVSYCYQPQNQQFLLFSSSLLCASGTGRTGQTGLECFVIGCFHNACKHRAFG
jgi:hypothetical protein